jgi:hypothetical protein
MSITFRAPSRDPTASAEAVHGERARPVPDGCIDHRWIRVSDLAASKRFYATIAVHPESARELHKRIATFLKPYAKFGRQLNSTVNAYDQGARSLDARVLTQLRRREDAGAGSEKPFRSSPASTRPRSSSSRPSSAKLLSART